MTTLNIRIDENVKNEFSAIAKSQGITTSALLNMEIRKIIEKHKEKNRAKIIDMSSRKVISKYKPAFEELAK